MLRSKLVAAFKDLVLGMNKMPKEMFVIWSTFLVKALERNLMKKSIIMLEILKNLNGLIHLKKPNNTLNPLSEFIYLKY
jgi:hypothetical protein